MKFISTKGREYKVDIRPSRWPRRSKDNCKSGIQWSVSCLLDSLHPDEKILEEFHIPGDNLYIDFFIPRLKLAVEVHGRQHFEYVEFFHGSRANFELAKNRDATKKEWCKINKITLVEINYDDTESVMLQKLTDK